MDTIICYVGGTAKGNPGPAAIAIYITDAKGTVLQEVAQTIGNASTIFAHYQAVMVGLQTLEGMLGITSLTTHIEIRLPDEQVKKQLNAEAKINEPGLVPMFIEIHNLRVEHFPLVTMMCSTAAENKEVNQLLNEVLDGNK